MTGSDRAVWEGTVYPQSRFSVVEDTNKTGFIMQADFYKFRGRGIIQTTWRWNYLSLIDFIQQYNDNNQTILSFRNQWAGIDRRVVATRSTTADWDALFGELEMACHAIRIFSDKHQDCITINLTSEDINAMNETPGSIYYMGRSLNGKDYGKKFRRRVVQILNALGNQPSGPTPSTQI